MPNPPPVKRAHIALWPCPNCYTEWNYPACENCRTDIPHRVGYWYDTGEPVEEGEEE